MNLTNYSVTKLEKKLKQKLSDKDRLQIEEKIVEMKERNKIFVDKLFKCGIFKLAFVEAKRRKIKKPNFADILQIGKEIIDESLDKGIKV